MCCWIKKCRIICIVDLLYCWVLNYLFSKNSMVFFYYIFDVINFYDSFIGIKVICIKCWGNEDCIVYCIKSFY